ncbi:MAG: SDR family NAD(P)-dependent oxidoreductase [Sphingomonas sp.]|uniref:SDR family NAD(P)-dependent oxidoreductase n=1 Tax=Sphingomonas sp. TaxID=28214 RepID=UPI001AC300D2|nr:SDR family NAD(P)-dependent oxidoreductase [Sphingomonas sp.]MBN8815252.1 SDR family NAD(P)-dependent oxidoreductase [Sphingomonas sp.]
MKISGSVVLLNGAYGGMGRDFAGELLKRGAAKFYVAARDTTSLREMLASDDPRLVSLPLDVTDPDQVAAAAGVPTDVTLLVNNAGYAAFEGAIAATEVEDARREMEVKYFGTLAMTRAFTPILANNGGGAALTTLGLVAGNVPAAAINGLILGGLYALAWKVAPIHLPADDWKVWALGFVAVEFAYYWFHRASHRIRWLWATHAVHHSAEQMTLLSSLRLGWTNLLSAGWIFYLPLILVGFDPRLVVVLLAFNLRYQFFLHTEARISLGSLEWLLNSPSHHHCVHHGRNDAYLDRNYGGVLIVFDRLFGTFRAEREEDPVEFGLKDRPPVTNPFKLVWREWSDVFGAMRTAGNVRGAIGVAISPPGSHVGKPDTPL